MNLDTIASLQTDFGKIYDENFNFRDKKIYSQQIADFNRRLKEIGISTELKPKEIELKLQQFYETLIKVPKFTDQTPNDMPASTTLNSQQLKDLGEQAEKRAQQKSDINAREKQTVEDFIKQNQERITRAQAVQEKLRDKVVYARVVVPDQPTLTETEQKDLDTLREYAKADETSRSHLIDDLAEKIEEKIKTDLKEVPEEQIKILARSTAVDITARLVSPEIANEIPVQVAILGAINKDIEQKEKGVVNKIIPDDSLLKAAKEGSVIIELNARNEDFTSRAIANKLLGPRIAPTLYPSPEAIQIILTEKMATGQSTHIVNLGDLNQNQIQALEHQNKLLGSLQQVGVGRTREILTSYGRTYLAEKMAGLPAGSVLKKTYSSSITQSILAKYGFANPVAWQTTAQLGQFGGLFMKIAPDTAGPILSLAGKTLGKEFVKPIIGQVAGKVATQAAGKATGAGLGATIGAVTGLTGGPLAIVTAAIGAAIGEAVSKIGSKFRVWWTNNKDKAGPAIAVGLGFGGLLVGGPTAGGIGFGLGLAATGTLGAFAFGAWRFFGMIGRSVGVTIATPIIVTLLVLPPLVAFIMLVINNSAYVVPPGLSSSMNGGADNPYMLVTKEANPTKLDNSSSNQTVIYLVTIKSLKGNLTNLKLVSSECNVIKKDKSKVNCPTEFLADIDGESVAAGSTKAFSFTGIYDSKYSDSLIYDSVTISANNEAGEEITTSSSASVCIGECPTDCLKIEGDWPSNALKSIQGARDHILAKSSGYVTKICAQYPDGLPLKYGGTNGNLWGYFKGTYLLFYGKGVGTTNDAIYTLSHEMLHALVSDAKAIFIYLKYIATPGILTETPRCFYSYNSILLEERLADSVAFSIMPIRYCSITGNNSNINQWPKHRDFVLQNILK